MNTNSQINQELVDYFMESLVRRGTKSQGTIANIRRDIEQMLSFIEGRCSGRLDAESIKLFMEELQETYKETSYVAKLSSLRRFVNWLNLSDNPFWDLRISLSHDEFVYYSYDDIFVRALAKQEDIVLREISKLILAFIYEYHLTLSELANLRMKDYNQAAATLKLRSTEIEASPSLRADLRAYLRETRYRYVSRDLTLDDYLIVDENGQEFSVAALRSRLAELEMRPVYLRRSRIMHLLEQGLSTEEIETKLALRLGPVYESFEQRVDYRLLKAYREFHPRAGV